MAFSRISIVLFCIVIAVKANLIKQQDNISVLEEYIQSKKSEVNHRYKLHYHVTPPVGWLNDPNGFSYYKGEYHLFYQYYPYDSKWGPMHWGHVSSPDLVEWKQLPTALVPEEEMCFSGSAIADGDDFVLMYTGRINLEDDLFYESQYLAYSNDGIVFKKYEGNPVLASPPNNSPHFRDPKIWKHEDYWYVVIGSNTEDERGRVLLYRSLDMKTWDFLSVIGESNGDMGYMWECPDLFELDGKFVFFFSPQGMEPQGNRYKNIHQTGYIIGSFDYETFEFVPEVDFKEIDFGHDFYASQTMEWDGKRFIIAWFNSWEVPYPEGEDGWTGAMTMVREINLVGDTIIQKPLESMLKLRERNIWTGDLKSMESVEFEKTGEVIINGDLSQKIELLLEGSDGGESAWLRWDPEVGKVVVDRGVAEDVRQMEWVPINSTSWRLFLDASSIELFCGEGEVVFSSRVYPDGNWRLTNLSTQNLDVEAYHLRRSIDE
ncbi:unnamed protein product [Chilo suppressalis]|uniref:Sucrose-6-phosphate hydrolase n=1 Tax=Chilo suppressalis TaxID=168631 RepID=A0ABN8L4H9_CHISP|nr:unnamed protein product [Chilo suppressalis]